MHYKRPYDAQMARNRSALGSVSAPGASNRDNTVRLILISNIQTHLVIDISSISHGNTFMWMSWDLSEDPAVLAWVVPW